MVSMYGKYDHLIFEILSRIKTPRAFLNPHVSPSSRSSSPIEFFQKKRQVRAPPEWTIPTVRSYSYLMRYVPYILPREENK
jgi:hypothetical protein